MKPFRERNPVLVGIVGLLVLAGILALALEINNLPFVGGGTTEHAEFTDASGLQPGDSVMVAGVNVGTVNSVSIDGDHVDVGFTVDNGIQLGDQTSADIKIQTLLGKMYLAVDPAGTGTLSGPIPVSRTTTPLNVTAAFIGLGRTAGRIDTARLAHAFRVLGQAFHGTPPYVRSSLRGLSRLSETIASRNAQITRLLQAANTVTGTLAARDAQITRLINDSNLILRTVEQQAAVIHRLLIDTRRVAVQLSGLVNDNEQVLGPALAKVQTTLHILQANQSNLRQSIRLAAPFVRDFTDVVGNGRWFESILQNLPGGLPKACVSITGGQCLSLGSGG